MRIAIDARAATETAAGRGRYLRGLLERLAALPFDHEVQLFGTQPWACPAIDADARMRWTVTALPPRLWPFAIAARSRRADVVLSGSSYLLSALTPRRAVTIVYDLAPFDRRYGDAPGAGFERVTAPLAVRRPGAFAAISETTARDFAARFPKARDRVHVVTPGGDPAFTPEGPSATRERPYVLAVGTLEPRKNLPRLIEAWSRVDPAVRGDAELVLAGGRGWESEATLAAAAADDGAVRALGFVADEELPALYRGAIALAYPSLYEGFGLPVLEALQSGTPVLTSRASSLPEVAGDAALYVDPEDPADIAAGLERLLADADLRARLAAAGPARAAHFDWTASARQMLALLEAPS